MNEKKKNRQRCDAVGLSSLLYDGREGTKGESHIFFCDLDTQDALNHPQLFMDDLQDTMYRYRVRTAYLFRTLKGVHVIAPYLAPRRITERFEEALEKWGSDGFHRDMSYRNGHAVIRLTPKPGEERGPVHIRTVQCARVRNPRVWSMPHFDVLRALHPTLTMPLGGRVVREGEFRMEAYGTWAVAPEDA